MVSRVTGQNPQTCGALCQPATGSPDYVGRGLEAEREGKWLKVGGLASESGLTHLGLTRQPGLPSPARGVEDWRVASGVIRRVQGFFATSAMETPAFCKDKGWGQKLISRC